MPGTVLSNFSDTNLFNPHENLVSILLSCMFYRLGTEKEFVQGHIASKGRIRTHIHKVWFQNLCSKLLCDGAFLFIIPH